MKKNESVSSSLCLETITFKDDLTTLLKEQNILTSLDSATFDLIIQTYNTNILMTKLLNDLSSKKGAMGYFVKSPRGELKPHPAIKIQHDSGIQLDKLLDRFGLNPEARRELAKPKEKQESNSPIQNFLESKKKVNVEVQHN
jgi:P27 family predicted phage terminase small subunit